jgi:hypothetical protein
MKKFFALFLSLGFFLAAHVCLADAHDNLVAKAQALKSAGKWEEAAAVHPRILCKAIYLWNAACTVCSHKDANGNWVINATVTADQKAQALALLTKAQADLNDTAQVGTVDEGCAGVEPKELQRLIDAVTDCLNGNCK